MASRPQAERRREARLLCADLVRLGWIDADGGSHEETANLEDISDHGVCLLLESAIAVGTAVEITAGSAIIRGQVRYSRHDELGEMAGVEFEAGTTWPKQSFKPKHLLDPRILLADEAMRNMKP